MSSKTAKSASRTKWLDKHGLSPRQRDFVLAYLNDPNATQAAVKTGYKHPDVQGPRLLGNVRVQAAIAEGRQQIEANAMLDADDVARHWIDIATADVNDLVQHRHGACRYCHGLDHEYRWTTNREYRQAFETAVYDLWADPGLRKTAINGGIEDPRLPTDAGGYGYRITDDPDPGCPECAGLGVEHVHVVDTRELSGAARLLYDGIEETRQGKKIKIADRAKAMENLAKHFGMFAGKVEDEKTSPLQRLADRIMASAGTAPIKVDAPETTTHNPTPKPEQGGREIEP